MFDICTTISFVFIVLFTVMLFCIIFSWEYRNILILLLSSSVICKNMLYLICILFWISLGSINPPNILHQNSGELNSCAIKQCLKELQMKNLNEQGSIDWKERKSTNILSYNTIIFYYFVVVGNTDPSTNCYLPADCSLTSCSLYLCCIIII